MQELFELTELADIYLKTDKHIDFLSKIRDIVQGEKYVGVAQINTISGDIENNAKKIAKYIKFAEKIGLECIVFPGLSLTGNLLKNAIKRHGIIEKNTLKWLKGLASLTKNTVVILGYAGIKDDEYNNCIAILKNGKVQEVINNGTKIFDNYAVTMDFNSLNLSEFLEKNTDNTKILINCTPMIYKQYNSMQSTEFSQISSKYNIPLLYVNQVGATDNLLFEGISYCLDLSGKLIARAKAFDEQLMIINPYKGIGKIYPLPNGYIDSVKEQENFSLDYEDDMERTYKALILGIRDYFSKCGLKRAVLGLSGGLDSTVCAVLLTDALGKENVLGVSMPSKITTNESKSDAECLAKNLGINFIEAPIGSIVSTISDNFNLCFTNIEDKWDCRYKKSFTQDNIQARTRATILWGISNEFAFCIPIATSDKSEAYMGYATINGDMSGGYAPIADITKTKLFALARWLNKNKEEKNVIPESVILKKPGAELAIDPKTGRPLIAEDALMPYEFLDEIIWRIENKNDSYEHMLDSEFLYEKNNSVSKEQKKEWLDKFYKRMSSALYKWTILPPSVMIEKYSIIKCDYAQPITSSGINYKDVSEEYINESLS